MGSRLLVRWGNPPHVTKPTWGPSPSCKEALNSQIWKLTKQIQLNHIFLYILIDVLQRIEKMIRKNAFASSKKKPGLNINPGLTLISLRRSVGFPGPHLLIKHSVCDRGFCGSRELTKMDGRVLSAPLSFPSFLWNRMFNCPFGFRLYVSFNICLVLSFTI